MGDSDMRTLLNGLFLNAFFIAALSLAPAAARAEGGIAAPTTSIDPAAAVGVAPATPASAAAETTAPGGSPSTDEYKSIPVGLLAPPLSDVKPVPVKKDAQLPQALGVIPGIYEIPGMNQRQQTDEAALTFDQVVSAYNQQKYDIVMKNVMPMVEAKQHDAEQLVGLMYLNGQGVDKDPKKAFEFLLRAAEANKALSQHYVAVMYFTGNGVEDADNVRALMWLTIAILHYPDGAEKARAKSDRDAILLKMSRPEKNRAMVMAREWLDKLGEGHLMDMVE
jgi:hypothetical protein